MDYKTKPTSREKLRSLVCIFRKLFEAEDLTQPFPVLQALEKLPSVFDGSIFEIVEDYELPKNEKANCMIDDDGCIIRIKQSVYDSAFKDNQGAARGFICHELCHVFLYFIGFRPILSRSFSNNEIPAYCSVEWQTKAFCGEVMMPYEETKNLSEDEIVKKYIVSNAFAEKRKTY